MNPLLTKEALGEKPAPIPAAPTSTRSKAKLAKATSIAALLIVAGATAGFMPHWRQQAQTEKDTAVLAISTVAVVSPEPGHVSNGVILPAEAQPLLQASIFARVSGYLKRWNVDIGAHVEAGQVLAEIDTPEIDQELSQARAQLTVAESNQKLGQITNVRWQQLLKTSSVSQQDADEKSAANDVAAATVKAEQANVRRLEEMQSFQKVVAPFSGIITTRNIDIGDLITAGSGRELFHIVQPDTLRLYVRAPQTMAADVQVGQSAEVLVPELPTGSIPAKVATTSQSISPTSRTLLVELRAENTQGLVRVGSYCEVRFAPSTAPAALTLPSSALLFRANGLQVGVVNDAGVVTLRTVTIGRDFGRRFEVLSGVTASDKVIATPSDSLVAGITVHPTPRPSPDIAAPQTASAAPLPSTPQEVASSKR